MGLTIVLKLFRRTLINIKAGSRKINRKSLRSTVAKIALWNEPLVSSLNVVIGKSEITNYSYRNNDKCDVLVVGIKFVFHLSK